MPGRRARRATARSSASIACRPRSARRTSSTPSNALAHELAPYDTLGIGVPGLVTRTGVIRASPNLVDIRDFAVGPLLSERLGHAGGGRQRRHLRDGRRMAARRRTRGGRRGDGHARHRHRWRSGARGAAAAGRPRVHRRDRPHRRRPRRPAVPVWPPRMLGALRLGQRARPARPRGRRGQAAAARRRSSPVDRPTRSAASTSRQAALAGDPEALAVIDQFGRWVAIGLVNLTNILDPELFVLGGGLARSPGLYLGPIARWFERAALRARPAAPPPARVRRAGRAGRAPSARRLLWPNSTD